LQAKHWKWIDESVKYNQDKHMVQFLCSTCGQLLTMEMDLAFDGKELVCDICQKPTNVPPIPCVRDWCNGVYEKCGGPIEAIDTSSYASGRDTDYQCLKCGFTYSYDPGICHLVNCNMCGHSPTTLDLPTLASSDFPRARHRFQARGSNMHNRSA